MKKKPRQGSIAFDIANNTLMALLAVVMLYPLAHVFAMSLSIPSAITEGRVTWFPIGFNTVGYGVIFQNNDLLRAYGNTIVYAAVGTMLTLVVTSLMAYPLSIRELPMRKTMTIFIAITMFFGGGLIPYYLVIRNLKLIDTFWVMIVPGCISAYNVFVYRAFFQGIPTELREAAFIDGANDLKIYYKIILPMSKPLLATFALFSIVGFWNTWYDALLFLNDIKRFPLQLVLRSIVVLNQMSAGFETGPAQTALLSGKVNPYNVQMAAIVITMAPILCIYPFVQTYFVKGMIVGVIKG